MEETGLPGSFRVCKRSFIRKYFYRVHGLIEIWGQCLRPHSTDADDAAFLLAPASPSIGLGFRVLLVQGRMERVVFTALRPNGWSNILADTTGNPSAIWLDDVTCFGSQCAAAVEALKLEIRECSNGNRQKNESSVIEFVDVSAMLRQALRGKRAKAQRRCLLVDACFHAGKESREQTKQELGAVLRGDPELGRM